MEPLALHATGAHLRGVLSAEADMTFPEQVYSAAKALTWKTGMKVFNICQLLLFSVMLFGSSTGCIKKNAEGRRVLQFIPAKVINSQSGLAFEEQKKKIPLSKDARRTDIVKRVADRLIVQAKQRYGQYCEGFQWEVQLFDEPNTVNAYCMPGGKIGIYTGILPVCVNEAALAAVMGHEIAHALLGHGNERVSQQVSVSGGLMALEVGLAMKSTLDKDMQKAVLAAAGLGTQVGVLLPYSRGHESEADAMGLRICAAAGYDPAEAPNLWRRMKSGGKAPPAFLSTHPSNDKRIKDLEDQQPEVRPLYEQSPQKYGLGETL